MIFPCYRGTQSKIYVVTILVADGRCNYFILFCFCVCIFHIFHVLLIQMMLVGLYCLRGIWLIYIKIYCTVSCFSRFAILWGCFNIFYTYSPKRCQWTHDLLLLHPCENRSHRETYLEDDSTGLNNLDNNIQLGRFLIFWHLNLVGKNTEHPLVIGEAFPSLFRPEPQFCFSELWTPNCCLMPI